MRCGWTVCNRLNRCTLHKHSSANPKRKWFAKHLGCGVSIAVITPDTPIFRQSSILGSYDHILAYVRSVLGNNGWNKYLYSETFVSVVFPMVYEDNKIKTVQSLESVQEPRGYGLISSVMILFKFVPFWPQLANYSELFDERWADDP